MTFSAWVSFGVLTLTAQRHKGHPAHKKPTPNYLWSFSPRLMSTCNFVAHLCHSALSCDKVATVHVVTKPFFSQSNSVFSTLEALTMMRYINLCFTLQLCRINKNWTISVNSTIATKLHRTEHRRISCTTVRVVRHTMSHLKFCHMIKLRDKIAGVTSVLGDVVKPPQRKPVKTKSEIMALKHMNVHTDIKL